jgi:XTP/dITP diphosphohydrolase
MRPLVVATGNPGKLAEMQRYLEGLAWDLELKPAELDVEETGSTFAENARLKASQIALATGKWAIADDSGLMVDALDGAPGVFSARYGLTDADRIARMLREMEGEVNRKARFICAVAIARPKGTIILEASGGCPGEITEEPQGSGGFGYDPIFYVPAAGMTFAEMDPEQKRLYSHRGRAFGLLVPKLEDL